MRIAVLGAGSIGMRHLRNLRSLGETDLHVYDADIAVQERLIVEGGAAVYATACDLWLAGPEVALICTPPQYHVDNALEAIRNGVKALFIEKPLADSMDGVDALVDYAARNGVITFVACNWRWRPGVMYLLQGTHPLYVEADVPIPPQRQTELRWDVDWHFYDLAVWSGRRSITVKSSYREPYRVMIERDGCQVIWTARYNGNHDYVREMSHFLEHIHDGTATGNDVLQAARTLRILLEAKERYDCA